jgi:hypothetical protein
MPGRHVQQTYVPTKKDPNPSLQTTHVSLIQVLANSFTACARTSEPTPLLDLSVVALDDRWLQMPTAERWELLVEVSTSQPLRRHVTLR